MSAGYSPAPAGARRAERGKKEVFRSAKNNHWPPVSRGQKNHDARMRNLISRFSFLGGICPRFFR